MKTVNALGRYAWLTTAMRRRRGAAFTTKTHPQFSKSVSRKDENAVTQDAERKAVCVFSVWEEVRRAVKYFLVCQTLEGMLEVINQGQIFQK